MHYDLIIIGTGTAAMVAAMRVRDAGWTVAVVDEKPFGGTCRSRERSKICEFCYSLPIPRLRATS